MRAEVKDVGGRLSVDANQVESKEARETEPLLDALDKNASNPDILSLRYGHGLKCSSCTATLLEYSQEVAIRTHEVRGWCQKRDP